jgi:hypothetical protein
MVHINSRVLFSIQLGYLSILNHFYKYTLKNIENNISYKQIINLYHYLFFIII